MTEIPSPLSEHDEVARARTATEVLDAVEGALEQQHRAVILELLAAHATLERERERTMQNTYSPLGTLLVRAERRERLLLAALRLELLADDLARIAFERYGQQRFGRIRGALDAIGRGA